MKILYVSCHSVLQVDEVKILRQLGHDVNIMEPSSNQLPDIPQNYYDVILICHRLDFLNAYISRQKVREYFGTAQVYYRSVGQSTPELEKHLKVLRDNGDIKIIRYSPQEQWYQNYAGSDGLVRFSKDENVYKNWNGNNQQVVMFANHIHNRAEHCKLKYMEEVTKEFNRILHGWGNEPIYSIPTQELAFDEIPKVMKNARVMFYTGTFPASYTLNFIEALMTGVPMVSISSNMFYYGFPYWGDIFEASNILDNKHNGCIGFVGSTIDMCQKFIKAIMNDNELAKQLSKESRQKALMLFSEVQVKKQWNKVLQTTLNGGL